MSLSAATSVQGLSPQVAKDSLAYLRRAIERMKSLQATERILACLEQARLQRVPEKLKLKPLVTAINSLNLALREGVEAKVQATRAVVQQELAAAVAHLVRRDARAMTYDLRRFCESEPAVLDLQALAALASFYYALPLSEASRSKYDFVITQLFSLVGEARQRHLKVSREQIAKRLTTMCQAWDEGEVRETVKATLVTACLWQFEEFIAEVQAIPTLEELITSAFFQRVRDFKTNLGTLFFVPAVTAASVAANVTIANSFLALLRKESQEFGDTPEVLPLADAFSDTYANEPEELARILAELQSLSHNEETRARVARFTQLLQLTEDERLSPSLLADLTPRHPDHLWELPADHLSAAEALEDEMEVEAEDETEVNEVIEATWEETEADEVMAEAAVDEALTAFAVQPENAAVLAAYRNASPAVRALELTCFLSPLPAAKHEDLKNEEQARRTALHQILQADQFIQQELVTASAADEVPEARVEALFDALGQSSDKMRELIKISHTHEQEDNYEVFLQVYNQLMAARLRLQSALVRRSAPEVIPPEVVSNDTQEEETTFPSTEDAPSQIVSETVPDETPQTPRWNARRKWLVGVAVVLLVVAVALRLLVTTEPPVTNEDTDVVRVAAKDMPHGALFAEIKLHRDMLLCVATEQWLTLGAADQKGKLQELLRFAQSHSAKHVLLIDAKGVTVGSATPEELYVN